MDQLPYKFKFDLDDKNIKNIEDDSDLIDYSNTNVTHIFLNDNIKNSVKITQEKYDKTENDKSLDEITFYSQYLVIEPTDEKKIDLDNNQEKEENFLVKNKIILKPNAAPAPAPADKEIQLNSFVDTVLQELDYNLFLICGKNEINTDKLINNGNNYKIEKHTETPNLILHNLIYDKTKLTLLHTALIDKDNQDKKSKYYLFKKPEFLLSNKILLVLYIYKVEFNIIQNYVKSIIEEYNEYDCTFIVYVITEKNKKLQYDNNRLKIDNIDFNVEDLTFQKKYKLKNNNQKLEVSLFDHEQPFNYYILTNQKENKTNELKQVDGAAANININNPPDIDFQNPPNNDKKELAHIFGYSITKPFSKKINTPTP